MRRLLIALAIALLPSIALAGHGGGGWRRSWRRRSWRRRLVRRPHEWRWLVRRPHECRRHEQPRRCRRSPGRWLERQSRGRVGWPTVPRPRQVRAPPPPSSSSSAADRGGSAATTAAGSGYRRRGDRAASGPATTSNACESRPLSGGGFQAMCWPSSSRTTNAGVQSADHATLEVRFR